MLKTYSIFSTIGQYFRGVFLGVRSLFGSASTAAPYLLNVNSGDLRKEVTEQYPDPVSSKTADDLPPRTRGLLHNDIEKCIGCRECEYVCPVQCIHVETESLPDTSKIWVSVFNIDFAKCIFCGLCAEVCQPASLVHTKQFEGAVYDVRDLVASFGRGHITQELRNKWLRQKEDSQDNLEEGSYL